MNPEDIRLSFSDKEVKGVTQAWIEIQRILVSEADPNDCMEFMREITERASYINHAHGSILENVFTINLV